MFKWCAAFLLGALGAHASWSGASTLSVTVGVDSLPDSYVQCHDPAAAVFGFDEQWQVLIDVDGNSGTGASGTDVLLTASTLPTAANCSPSTVSTAGNIMGSLSVWDAGSHSFMPTSNAVNVRLDFSANTIELSTALTGPLSTLSPSSRISASSIGVYTSPTAGATDAHDPTDTIIGGGTVYDALHDVLGCAVPCSTAMQTYPFIDITQLTSTTLLHNQLVFEFDVASLPDPLELCRFPDAFANEAASDSTWNAAFIGSDFKRLIRVKTVPQSAGCTPHSVSLAQALSGEIDLFDSSGNPSIYGDIATVRADSSAGKIYATVELSSLAMQGFDPQQDQPQLITLGLYAAPTSWTSGASDQFASGSFAVEQRYSDPKNDLSSCSPPCSASASWYPQIDLVGGAVSWDDAIFHSGFE